MAYDLYLGKALMPITPEKITYSISNRNETVSLINDGEINILKAAGLKDIEFTVILPQVQYPFAKYASGFQTAEYFLNYFEQLKNSIVPFQFIFSRAVPDSTNPGKWRSYNTNLSVSLENYSVIEDVQQGFDVKVEIHLKQYRSYGTKTITVPETPTAPVIVTETRPATTNPTPATTTSGGGSGGNTGGGGTTTREYEVKIEGMGTVTVKATSPADAMAKAGVTSPRKWTTYVRVKGTTTWTTFAPEKQTTTAKDVVTTISTAVQKVAATVKTTVSNVVSTAKNAVSNLVSKITTSTGKTTSTPKTTTTSTTTSKVTTAVKSAVSSVASGLKSVVAKLKR